MRINMQIIKRIFQVSFIFSCLLCLSVSFAQKIPNFTCDFENPNTCQWTQDQSDNFDWIRNQGATLQLGTGPLTDHTKSSLTNGTQGPGSLLHRGGQCIHILYGARDRPIEGQILVLFEGCRIDRLEFRLFPNGTLMLTKHNMCVKPIKPMTDGVRVGVFSNCDVLDTWSWTAQGSLQYRKNMCLKPETGEIHPRNEEKLVLRSNCNEQQNVFQFVVTSGWYLFIGPRRLLDEKARLISPSTTETNSCLIFFYFMFGAAVRKLQVYVKSGDNMNFVWGQSGEQGYNWYQAQVAVNNQMTSYQFVIEGFSSQHSSGNIAIDDISLMVSCPPREDETTTPTSVDNKGSTSTVSITPVPTFSTTPVPTFSTTPVPTFSTTLAILTSQTSPEGTKDDSSKTIIIAITTVAAGVLLIVCIVLLIICRRWKHRALKLSTPVDIPLEANKLAEPLPVHEEPVYETVENFHPKFYDENFAKNANESEDIPAKGRISDYKDVEKTSDGPEVSEQNEIIDKRPDDTLISKEIEDDESKAGLKPEDLQYVIPCPEQLQCENESQNETCEGRKLSQDNEDSEYLTPVDEIQESYDKDIQPNYLDLSERENDHYQKLMK